MTNKMTPWFPASTPPKRVGVYEVTGGIFSKWNGRYWCFSMPTPDSASKEVAVSSHMKRPSTMWRGFMKETK